MLNLGYLTSKTDKASDEVYTPAYAVEPLLPHLAAFQSMQNHPITIWCPMDKEDSEFVKVFQSNGYQVIYSHVDNEQNFFTYEPSESYDIIISNPPFSIKDQVIKRLWELQKPYAMIMPVQVLQGQKRFPYMEDCQALVFDKRINFYTDPAKKEVQKGVAFGSIYLCRNFLKRDLTFQRLEGR